MYQSKPLLIEPKETTSSTAYSPSAPKRVLLVGLLLAGLVAVTLFALNLQSGDSSETPSELNQQSKSPDVSYYGAIDLFYQYNLNQLTGEDYVCADGTDFVFYVHRPNETSPNYNKWIVRVEGGGRWCEDDETCEEQYEEFDGYYLTSMFEQCIYRDPEGGLSCVDEQYNPRFFDWSSVWIHACNGDDWLGQARSGENGNPTEWHFTGSINMWATFEYLQQWIILEPESLVVAGGDTAGHSLENQLNTLDEWWSEHYPAADLHFIIDGAWNHEEYMCYDEATCEPYLGNVTLRYQNQNLALNPDCLADGHAEKCFFAAEYSAKYIHSDVLDKTIFLNSHFDQRMLASAGAGKTEEWMLERAEYLHDLQIEDELQNLWETSCSQHALGNKKDWYLTTNPDGLVPMEAVWAVVSGDSTWSVDDIYIVDEAAESDKCAGGLDYNFPGNRDSFDVCPLEEDFPEWYRSSLAEIASSTSV